MQCALYDADRCRSCQWLEKPYSQQLSDKQARLEALLAQQPVAQWLPPVTSAQQAFRNKAKMVVSGSVERPVLGMVQRDGSAVDLSTCPLYPESFAPVFAALKPFIARAGLTPYNVARRRGELKFLLLTESTQGGMMLRFVLRSREKLDQLRAALPWLQQQLPQLKVISANIQPVHMAILEGDEEIALTPSQSLAESFNQVPLWIRPQSFFQTNPQVAAALYATARDWVRELAIGSMWDLFCGVGGFGLHCATPQMQLTGIEISAEAIACAQRSAEMLGLEKVSFAALDSTAFATGRDAVPDLVLVNPPRRGIGKALCDYLSRMAPGYILYSSCNPESMAQDIARLADYRVTRVQLFDMFPHTAHFEVLSLLTRQDAQEGGPAS
ncbi:MULTISPECIES: 23S rRNA (uracil(747)-C(5))-methyltransferase RlmC [Pantoea]|jgi:23S rRNA (uracil747-C5)-methyltransferase|uniref:23S rRNA (uracil(747)-C(5))-methyltransferase RlmC n=1 Tax=Pantoea TaxID=53335 RepID=UPI000EA29B25|nr:MULTISPECIES: 23S rRNA (uracil(747)-C(5))-methyltransferase RlmC [Pantoea]MBZ6388222.1 23S rRNA (uracil(747)-C(5))-methyltransferase RlmC [Pantoea piersonii]MBZ6401442.1 23S rRNA (uracil(747)-C(5))-methyltransferase RlmC [Pantoea piersonii]MBZ6409067.1 23S rRNA (uracil(747)-C(5))-methyltransferase RlmC [Pantoea piersonii]MBZ6428386.1 23S rRNA (uracil(747)-C(5))-methyltransferase RlmC [Pantoea piersonii]NYB01310.1 23S rRNA (uracil(747)-C(5))-methyltransferase RlmC [Pantoea piersonii]